MFYSMHFMSCDTTVLDLCICSTFPSFLFLVCLFSYTSCVHPGSRTYTLFSYGWQSARVEVEKHEGSFTLSGSLARSLCTDNPSQYLRPTSSPSNTPIILCSNSLALRLSVARTKNRPSPRGVLRSEVLAPQNGASPSHIQSFRTSFSVHPSAAA